MNSPLVNLNTAIAEALDSEEGRNTLAANLVIANYRALCKAMGHDSRMNLSEEEWAARLLKQSVALHKLQSALREYGSFPSKILPALLEAEEALNIEYSASPLPLCPFCNKRHKHSDSPGAIVLKATGCPEIDK